MMSIPEPIGQPFDFGSHQRRAMERYQGQRATYDALTGVIKHILGDALERNKIKVASIEVRAKSVESFGAKALTRSSGDPGQPRYKDPMNEIQDLAGIRVITYFPKTVSEVGHVIEAQFDVLDNHDKADVLIQEERFGYRSVHYVIALRSDRTILPEYARFKGLVAEIQVRTILQHAWAEIEHDIQYKSLETIPSSVRRRFMSLAGLLEIADREFQAVQNEDEEIRQQARKSIEEGRLGEVEITSDALKAYLDKKIGPDDRIASYSYEWAAQMLRRVGFSSFQQIDECVKGFSDDQVSKIVWGTRQGQITRFEALLLAGMGDEYINRHPWATEIWFKGRWTHSLKKLKQAGVAVRTYVPV